MSNEIGNLVDLLQCGVSPFHVVEQCYERLTRGGFQELKLGENWEVKKDTCYVIRPYASVLFAFRTGEEDQKPCHLRIGMAHTDQPMFKLKPKPEMRNEGYCKVNVEQYGGMIYHTWLDRPLGVAGKVALRSDDVYTPEIRLFDSHRPIMTIPNLAIHLNRETNKGIEWNPQNDLLPLVGLLDHTINQDGFFMEYLAEELGVEVGDILDFDLYIYHAQEPVSVGLREEFLLAPRLDNLASVQALTDGILTAKASADMRAVALFDNEEIGSRSKQGADSDLFRLVLKKLCAGLDLDWSACVANGFLVSMDGAHGLHPNHPEKCDPTNKVQLGQGIVLKTSAAQRYVTDCEASAIVLQLCEAHGIACQKNVNRSDITGGQTLGPIAGAYLPMKAADLGIPMLAMHSANELAAKVDYQSLAAFAKAFLE